MPERSLLLYGTTAPRPEQTPLVAGPVSMVLEAGALRTISIAGLEVVRGIAFLVRDRNWNTLATDVVAQDINISDEGFAVNLTVLCGGDGRLTWEARIEGSSDGTVTFSVAATPMVDLKTNRAGFVILHPTDRCAGSDVEVSLADGTRRKSCFPEDIDPEPCFTDVVALSEQLTSDLRAEVIMEGGIWEMEDQRNWLDASFKSYVRPLRLPRPYTLEAEKTFQQAVTFRVEGQARVAAQPKASEPFQAALPQLALRYDPRFPITAPDSIRASRLAYRVDMRDPVTVEKLPTAVRLANDIGADLALEAVVPCQSKDPQSELTELAAIVLRAEAKPESLMLAAAETEVRLDPGPPVPPQSLHLAIHRAARKVFPNLAIGGGTFANFAELNRNLPPFGLIDFLGWTASSIVHAADEETLAENIACFADQARTARALAGPLPLRLLSSTIALPDNRYAPPIGNPENERVTNAEADPRHRALAGATWTLASIAAAAEAGFASIAPAALAGPAGLSGPEGRWPIAMLLERLYEQPMPVEMVPLGSDMTCLKAGNMILIGNLATEPRPVDISGLKARNGQVLDHAALSAGEGLRSVDLSRPLVIDAQAIVFLQSAGARYGR